MKPNTFSPRLSFLFAAALLTGCGSIGGGAGISVPLGRHISLGVGVGTGGVTAGVGTSAGPVGVGVGVNSGGQVTGNVGVGVSTGIGGGARVGAGVGTGTVLYDPNAPERREMPARPPQGDR